jgi:hypothetical protein
MPPLVICEIGIAEEPRPLVISKLKPWAGLQHAPGIRFLGRADSL